MLFQRYYITNCRFWQVLLFKNNRDGSIQRHLILADSTGVSIHFQASSDCLSQGLPKGGICCIVGSEGNSISPLSDENDGSSFSFLYSLDKLLHVPPPPLG